MNNMPNITKRERDFLLIIGNNRNSRFPVRISHLARQLEMKMPTAEEIAERLVSKGLLYKERGLLVLSDEGFRCYKDITMKHRAMETLLADCGIDADEACREVSSFDYLLYNKSAEKIIEKLGNPEKCPHGRNIVEG